MPFTSKQLEKFAKKHGVSLDTVSPPDFSERRKTLESLLAQQNVPFPVTKDHALSYLENSHLPFSLGTLSDKSISLGEYQNHQDYNSLSFEDHLSWACLIANQKETKERYACIEYLRGENAFPIKSSVIPDYHILNARLYQQTGWQLATVSTIIPSSLFFQCHRHKFFPVTTFMRPLGTDYLEEPDIGHDLAGHIATFTIPQVAEIMKNHGIAHERIFENMKKQLLKAKNEEEIDSIKLDAEELLVYAGRIYWFTVEFGLVMQNDRLTAFGAGILSSPSETPHSIESAEATRILIDPNLDRDLLRLATTDYSINEYQKTYFVLRDFESLTSITPERIIEIVTEAKSLPHLGWRDIIDSDQVITSGTDAMAPNDKYESLARGIPLDDTSKAVAERNIKWAASKSRPAGQAAKLFLASIPLTPDL
jgi:phenylalanine-4-hydroxylase